MKPLTEEQINYYNKTVSTKQEIDNIEQMILTQINEMRLESDEFTLTPNDVNPEIWETLIVETSKEIEAIDKVLRNKIKNLIRKTKVNIDNSDEEIYIPEDIKKEGRSFYTQPVSFVRTDNTVTDIVEKIFEVNENEIYTDIDKNALIEAIEGFDLEENKEISAEQFTTSYQNIASGFNPAVAADIILALYAVPDRLTIELIINKFQFIYQSTQQQDAPHVEEESVEKVEGEVEV